MGIEFESKKSVITPEGVFNIGMIKMESPFIR